MNQTLHLTDLVVGYRQPLLGPVSLSLTSGIHILLGKNGSGKTTLMRTVAGILPPLSGSVTLAAGTQVGYLGHQAALSEGLTVGQNLRFWQRVTQLYAEAGDLQQLSEQFGLHDLWPRRVRQLSRGQRQLSRGQRQRSDLARVGLTQVGLARPGLFLLDEPLTGLDPLQAQQMRQKMREWAQHAPLIYSTHSLPEALEMSDSFLVVTGGGLQQLTSHSCRPEAELLRALEGS